MIHKDYPEEYIRGEVIFFGKKFFVTPDVLIPRLETESLVRRARKIIQSNQISTVIDIGTGSGIIGVSCADDVEKTIFVDISGEALSVAKKNYREYFSLEKAEFIQSDLFASLPHVVLENTLIVSNLPYIHEGDWENMSEDTQFEPKLALFGWETTGFELYQRFFEELEIYSKDSQNLHCLIEFGYDQRDICELELKKYGWKYTFFIDYAGIERFCEIELTN
jgi:release factor glutamine methyltransferase